MLVQAGQAFAGLEILLDGPAQPSDFDQGDQRGQARAVAAVEGEFAAAAVAADQQVPVSGAGGAWLTFRVRLSAPARRPAVEAWVRIAR
jgi:hypothetical protein